MLKTLTTSESYFNIQGLHPSTTYDFYFTGICSATAQSKVTSLTSVTAAQGICNGTVSVSGLPSSPAGILLSMGYNGYYPSYYQIEYGPAGFTFGTGIKT